VLWLPERDLNADSTSHSCRAIDAGNRSARLVGQRDFRRGCYDPEVCPGTSLACGPILNLFAAPLKILSKTLHGIATCERAQQAQQHQSSQYFLKHNLPPVSVRMVNTVKAVFAR
jgi:hypothetical protein